MLIEKPQHNSNKPKQELLHTRKLLKSRIIQHRMKKVVIEIEENSKSSEKKNVVIFEEFEASTSFVKIVPA